MDGSVIAGIVIGVFFVVLIYYVSRRLRNPDDRLAQLDVKLDAMRSTPTYAIAVGLLMLLAGVAASIASFVAAIKEAEATGGPQTWVLCIGLIVVGAVSLWWGLSHRGRAS